MGKARFGWARWATTLGSCLLLAGPALAGGGPDRPLFGIGGLAPSRGAPARGADLSEWFGWETTPDDILAACLLAIAVIAIVWMIVKERPASARRS